MAFSLSWLKFKWTICSDKNIHAIFCIILIWRNSMNWPISKVRWHMNYIFKTYMYMYIRRKHLLYLLIMVCCQTIYTWLYKVVQCAYIYVYTMYQLLHSLLYARLKNGRILPWQCLSPSSFCTSFRTFFNMLRGINLKLRLCNPQLAHHD